MKYCPDCQEMKSLSDFYTSRNNVISTRYRKCHTAWNKRHRVNNAEAVATRRRDRNRQAISEARARLGGKCSHCGYDKYQTALEFHHLDPRDKVSEVSYIAKRNKSLLDDELKKCILLCANCHRGLENGEWNAEDLKERLVGRADQGHSHEVNLSST